MNSTSPSAPSARPLLVRFAAFGDAVLLTPLIRQLSERFASPIDLLSSGPWTKPLLAGQPGVGDIVIVRSRKTPYWASLDQQRAVRWLRARGPGPTWFADISRAGRGLLTRAGIGEEWIVDAGQFPFLPKEHAIERWRRFGAAVPAAIRDSTPVAVAPLLRGCEIVVSDAARADLHAWLQVRGLVGRPLLLVQAGNKRTMRAGARKRVTNTKYWPEANWAAVIRGMRETHPRHAILLAGAGHEYSFNHDIIRQCGVPDVHNVADDLPIPRLLALLERADSLLTVDSGPAHAAAAVGCPMVDLFGRASVDEYRPWGSTSAEVKCLTGMQDGEPDMLGIRVDTVLTAWRKLRPR